MAKRLADSRCRGHSVKEVFLLNAQEFIEAHRRTAVPLEDETGKSLKNQLFGSYSD